MPSYWIIKSTGGFLILYKQITIYVLLEILSKKLGPQNWWPAENTEDMLSGMILIQNTNWKNADRSLANLKQATNFETDRILALSTDEMEQLIQPSGFFHNKAIYLRSMLTAYRDNFDDWSKLSTPLLRKKLIALSNYLISPITPSEHGYSAKFDLETRLEKFRKALFDYKTGARLT